MPHQPFQRFDLFSYHAFTGIFPHHGGTLCWFLLCNSCTLYIFPVSHSFLYNRFFCITHTSLGECNTILTIHRHALFVGFSVSRKKYQGLVFSASQCKSVALFSVSSRDPRCSVVQCLTRNLEAPGLSRPGSPGFFVGESLGMTLQSPSLKLGL